ncbi:YadA-like family protein [Escherichia coli]|uniref:YadA-like family protein n=1 Tax=Escherichia coli TaxID=562 RepID=UPI0015D71DE7|nr:YadA-like family protein [Escherichia coli]NZA86190.1 YadA-like family protein [Escherichia coli]
MNKKFTKTILSAAVVGLFLAGNASVQVKAASTSTQVKAASTSTEEYYTFGTQSDGTQYRLSRNDGGHSATFRLVKIDGKNKKEVAIPGLTDIEKDGSVYVTGYNGERTKVEAGDVSTMVKYILDEKNILAKKNTGPYNKAVNKNSEANAPVKGYIDAASEAARTVALKPALGKGAVASEQYTVAVGNGAKATEKFATSVGSWSAALGRQSVALGVGAYAYADASTAAGTAAYVDGSAIYGTAIGNYAKVDENATEGVALGAKAKVDKNATEGVALGAKAISAHKNSVALGANSRTTRDNEVYIGYEEASGKAYKTRTLGGLTDGTRPSDAATVRQVDRVKDSVEQLAQDTNTRLVVEAKKSREYTDSRTTVGVNPDGKLTRAEGATKTIAVNDGLVALSGRTDRIDAAVGSVDRRVTKNTQAIQSNTRQLQEHNARLNSQQRQIRENHEEMKRAAAQSAALAGLFQPYRVGKFNAPAALGGYSDKQAIAVGVGYRFNEQTAAKAGIAASDGDVSYNMGVNFEF